MKSIRQSASFVAAATVAGVAAAGGSVEMTWDNDVVLSNWNLIANWVPPIGELPSVPDTAGEAAFVMDPDPLTISTEITLDMNPVIDYLTIENPNATLYLGGNTLTVLQQVSNSGLVVADTGTSTISGTLTTAADLQVDQGATLVLDGPTVWNFGDILVNTGVGAPGPAVLRFEDDVELKGLVVLDFGDLILDSGAQAARVEIASGFTLTNDENHTIRGDGVIEGAVNNQGDMFGDLGGGLDVDGAGGAFTTSGPAGLGSLTAASIAVEAGGSLFVDSGVTQIGGTVTVDGQMTCPTLLLVAGAALGGTGTVSANVTNDGGTVGPGGSVGTLTVDSYLQVAGCLSAELGGTGSGQFDVLDVLGGATVADELKVSAISGMIGPSVGQSYVIVTTAGGVNGAFDTVTPEWGSFSVQYGQDVTITVTDWPQCAPEDLDNNGQVGINDFLGTLAVWGPCKVPPPGCPGDNDDDGEVGILDFLNVLSAWGVSCW